MVSPVEPATAPCQSPTISGAVWAVRADALRAVGRLYCTPMRVVEVAQERAIDIDEPLDLIVAEAVGRHFGFGLVEAHRREAVEGSAGP